MPGPERRLARPEATCTKGVAVCVGVLVGVDVEVGGKVGVCVGVSV
jgi:hypothetical protein